jgi:tRNA-dihydrouridine synthase
MSTVANFWNTLPHGFIVGAPMDDVTDVAFRTTIARRGKPHVTYTEFTSADGLVLAPEPGKTKLLRKLAHSDIERPIVAQLFSAVPERMQRAAKLVAELGFDGLDINTGCPDKTVEKQGCGSALIKNPELFKELYRAALAGIAEAANTEARPHQNSIPLAVKCRIGYSKPAIDTWLRTILEMQPAAMIVHLRTRDEMSKVPAHWELMPEILALRDAVSPTTKVVGNGDVKDIAHAAALVAQYGCDGVMIGRGMFGNPWYGSGHIATREERIAGLIEHIGEFERQLAGIKSFQVMKKHFGSYMSHFEGAPEIRLKLMETNSAEESLAILNSSL